MKAHLESERKHCSLASLQLIQVKIIEPQIEGGNQNRNREPKKTVTRGIIRVKACQNDANLQRGHYEAPRRTKRK